MAYENNHYIPQFILRAYGDRINVFDVKNQILNRNMLPNNVFFNTGIYPPDLEKNIGYLLEAPFAKLFHDKLERGEPGEKITLTRKELVLMKKFFLLEMMRVEAEKDNIQRMRETFEYLTDDGFAEKKIPGETTESRWHRNLQTIIETSDLREISKHELCTHEVKRWSTIFLSGYFAIWDCSRSETDFIINDIGMTSELEDSYLKDGLEHEKIDYLNYLIQREAPNNKRTAYEQLLQIQFYFYENFYMFPLSKSRMIVLINPFFRLYDVKEKLFQPSIWPSHIESKILFEKNISPKVPIVLGQPLFKDDDEFIYTIQDVSDSDTEYVNMLMLDRVDKLMGFGSINRVRKSIQRYIDFYKEINMKPPVDYDLLLKKITNGNAR